MPVMSPLCRESVTRIRTAHISGQWDIWHTCEPLKIGDEGWVGRLVRELDPQSQNVLTGVSFGQGLPRACALAGIPVTSVGDLDNYGLMTSIGDEAPAHTST